MTASRQRGKSGKSMSATICSTFGYVRIFIGVILLCLGTVEVRQLALAALTQGTLPTSTIANKLPLELGNGSQQRREQSTLPRAGVR
jgi:hypothetical protein